MVVAAAGNREAVEADGKAVVVAAVVAGKAVQVDGTVNKFPSQQQEKEQITADATDPARKKDYL